MKLAKFVVFLGVFSLCSNYALAENQTREIDLDEVVITPYRYCEGISNTAASVTKITPKDIKNSGAEKVIDVLRPVPGIVVRDWYGNGTKASVDMRGFGEQGQLNVLVLIDGRRINEVDLSGVDWSQIPLTQVESIEIIRGGSGSVLYGDNATSGVINIITKTLKGKPKLELTTEYGSYNKNLQSISLGGSQKKLSYFIQATQDATNGYRRNSFYKIQDYFSKFNYDAAKKLSLNFSSGFHSSSYGLPASLYQSNIDANSRRYARNGQDHANDKDYYFVIGDKSNFDNFGCVDVNLSFRRKEVDSYFLTSGLNTQKSKIDTFSATPKYTLEAPAMGHKNKFILGLDFYHSDYSMNAFDKTTNILQSFTDVNKYQLGGYLQNELFILEKLILLGGFRYESVKYEFDYHDQTGWNPAIDLNIHPNKKAYNGGLLYNFQKDSSMFVDISKSFRFPAVDEFTYNDANWMQQLNTNLKPQESINFEFGVRNKLFNIINSEISIFRMNVKNEIYYNYNGGPLASGQNENYDKTYHQGLEVSVDSKMTKRIGAFGNYTFTQARFRDGVYNQNDIPLVPRHKASLGLRLSLPANLTFNVQGNYVGSRYFLNDQSNAQSRLNGYMTMDLNLAYKIKDLTATIVVNNVLNKYYSEYAGYNGFTNDKFYYPSPGRNLNLKLEYKF
ncbi:MAG: TonB-dependent receptor [Candidatus Omnitrophica bacterium]|nr:TonB-dependent receptor [Candidatus Omnitrophota bacterium]